MKYYKITNEEECHHGMQYQDGLNIDIKEFNPSGSCEPGGIYYSSEDIFSFLSYGVWIREVTIPEDAQTYKDPDSDIVKWKADKVILGPRRRITFDIIKELIDEGANIHAQCDYVLRTYAERGNLEAVKYLVEHGADIHADNDFALRYASRNGYFEVVKYLVEQGADIHAQDDYVLHCALAHDHLDIAEYLKKEMEKK